MTGTLDAAGVCVRCAGARIFALALEEKPGSTPPIPGSGSPPGLGRIGPYRILSELGRGGMGAVYLAQHGELGRVVALKVVPSRGGATSDLEMRFLREARTIARLTHPHIVTVHDAGRDHGHAYFSMDYFEEGDLATRLRGQPFSPRDAAALLQPVAAAVAYSHAAGVLHRDLKPSNILLARGAPHVADFGLAAELDRSSGLTARTTILGTPHYLAPEALSHGSAAQDVRSDIYALGVILYEMLAGRTPFAGASPAELPGLLARGEAPDLRLLAPQVPADLATICAKCLEFEPARRYATAADLAEDLRRFLAGEPIAARPVSAVSQLFRWARRRPALAAIWVLSFLLVAASLTSTYLINRERLRADQAAQAASIIAEFLRKDLLEQASPRGASERDILLRTAIDRAVERIPNRFAGAPLAEADIRYTLGSTYQSLGEFNQAERNFRRTRALRRLELGPEHLDTLRATVELAAGLNNLGRSPEAATFIRTARASLVRQLGTEHEAVVNALLTEANVERGLGQISRAEGIARQTVVIARRKLGPDHELFCDALTTHATMLESQGKIEDAATLLREVVAIAERLFGPTHFQTLGARISLAAVETQGSRVAAAEVELRGLHALFRERRGPEHPETLRALSNLGSALMRQAKLAEADAVFTELVALRRHAVGDDHPSTLLALKQLAIARGRNGRLEEAITLMRELVEVAKRSPGLGPEHLTTLTYLRNLSGMLQSAGRIEESVAPAQAAYDATLRQFGPDDRATLADAEMLGSALMQVGRFREAEPVWRKLAESLTSTQPDHWRTYFARGQLGRMLDHAGRPAEAEVLLRESYEGMLRPEAALPASRRDALRIFAEHLATIYEGLGRSEDAATWRAKAAAKR